MRHGGRKDKNEIVEKINMEALKLKIFDVLTETISVGEFEQWLYADPKVLKAIDSDELVFDVISLNYKERNSLDTLLKLTSEKFNYQENTVISIVSSCKKINALENKTLIFQEVSKINEGFDYETNYSLLWIFFSFNEQIYSVEEGFLKEGDIISRIKNLAEIIISKFENYSSLSEKLRVLDYKDNIVLKPWWKFW